MTRPELHHVRRPFFDCTSVKRVGKAPVDETMHLHAEMTRPLPRPALRYSDIKVALRLVA